MSQDTRKFFARLTHFFKLHFDSPRLTSDSSNANVTSTNPTSIQPSPHQLSPLPSSYPPNLPAPTPLPHTPFRGTPPPRLSTLQPLAPLSLQLYQCSIESEGPSLELSPSSPSNDALAPLSDLPLRPPTPDEPPLSLQLPVRNTLTSQSDETATLEGAHDFVIYNPRFYDTSPKGSGIDKLLQNSMPDAFHNSAARYPPPRCHLGTRNNYIAKITDWAIGNSNHQEPILWMRGPFGVGKTAVAQSCAEAFQSRNKLAATLFFSRSNMDRDDPRRVVTSIAYQIATICRPFRDIVDACIRNDPAFATKSLSTQFAELLVHPLKQIDAVQNGIKGRVVVIDGLDECRGTSGQREILEVIAASARNCTTPFRWFITSRPEEAIIQTMNSDDVSPVSFHLELPVSRDTDHEILVYLTDEFEKIRRRHGLPNPWPLEEALALLVERTAGLWIYASTIIRFIMDENSLGPEDQLRIVLEFARDISARGGLDNPLAEMDFFYTLIMRRVPYRIQTLVRKILLLDFRYHPQQIAGILGLPEKQLRRACASIQSVMEVQGSSLGSMRFHFYHASFLDFMKDPERSKELCIYGDFLIDYRRERLDWLHQVCSHSTGLSPTVSSLEPVLLEGWDYNMHYAANLDSFWVLCGVKKHPFDSQTAASLEKLRFRTMLRLIGDGVYFISTNEHQFIRDNLPTELRDKIIRKDNCPTRGCTSTKSVWIFGHGDNETVAACYSDGDLKLTNNQDPRPGWCVCGSKIKMDSFSTKASRFFRRRFTYTIILAIRSLY